ncbi:acyl-CoA dehydrogenase family protein [Pararobbsia silviterrae]|uniref:Dibenzothiophene monooxygenase n=1 Tax=Pararobbsia silviterrae TaxID=1792498 RepID=A0A494XYW2_9BURK|nr:acyl-CoA dehydrogenase family protein [Pararobbsia silviterrae]RKP55765.1 monooxygenase [Pararobbsia silviterrae]
MSSLASPALSLLPSSPPQIAQSIADWLSETAIERDKAGGTPKIQRDMLRESGLLGLSIEREFGGLGASWSVTLETVRILARADSSIAHVYGFHHLMLATAGLFGERAQWAPLFDATIREKWFWGNTLNPLDTRTVSTPREGWREFNGQKTFCSGALDSDMLIASARQDGLDRLVIAAIPTTRTGITLHEDWDNIGQRQTDSGGVTFERVRVDESEIFARPGPLGSIRATLRPLIAQATLTQIYLGIAEGAFDAMRDYVRTDARHWPLSSADRQAKDPYALERGGEFWLALESARALTERASTAFDRAWEAGDRLTSEERGDTAIAIATAKLASAKAGLDITTRLFDVLGARSTRGELGLDRFWRNLRTHTLHDPLDYKTRELGDWAINRELPRPTFYS